MAPTRSADLVKWGFADIYIADADTAQPASAGTLVEPSTGWTGVGFTAEGLSMEVGSDVEEIRVEESLTPVGRVLTATSVTVAFDFAEDTVENRLLAYGFGSITTTAAGASQIGKKTLVLGDELEEKAICIVADNAYGFKDRIYIPRVMAGGTVGTSYRRAEKRVYPVEFMATCEPSDIVIVQQTAAATA